MDGNLFFLTSGLLSLIHHACLVMLVLTYVGRTLPHHGQSLHLLGSGWSENTLLSLLLGYESRNRGDQTQQKTGTHNCSLKKREQQISSWGTNWLTLEHSHIFVRKSLLWIQAYVPDDKLQHIDNKIKVNGSSRCMLVTSHTHSTHTCKYIQVCRHTGRQITTRRGLACRQTDERRDARTMMTAHHCCWWVDCEKDGCRWWNEETQTEGETDRCGVSWPLSQSSYISTGWSVKKQMEVQRGGTSVEPHGSVLSSSDTGSTDRFRWRSYIQGFFETLDTGVSWHFWQISKSTCSLEDWSLILWMTYSTWSIVSLPAPH